MDKLVGKFAIGIRADQGHYVPDTNKKFSSS